MRPVLMSPLDNERPPEYESPQEATVEDTTSTRGTIEMDEVMELGQFEIRARFERDGIDCSDGWVFAVTTNLDLIEDAERTIKTEADAAVRWGETLQNALPNGYSTTAPGLHRPEIAKADAASEVRNHSFRMIRHALTKLGYEVVS